MPLHKALFLDRDGVINRNERYVYKKEDFYFIEGIFDLVTTAHNKDYSVILITNQGGIGAGFYAKNQFLSLMRWVRKQLPFDAICYCPHHPAADCKCRKPKSGMLIGARDLWNIDMGASVMIGDMETDMQAAKNAEVGMKILFAPVKIRTKTVADAVITHLKQAETYL